MSDSRNNKRSRYDFWLDGKFVGKWRRIINKRRRRDLKKQDRKEAQG